MDRIVGGGLLVLLLAVSVHGQAQSHGAGSRETLTIGTYDRFAVDPRDPSQLDAIVDVWDQTFAVTGQLGFGTPVGSLGAEIDYSVASLISFSAGTGIGRGIQLAGGLRVRPLRGNVTALGIGAGFSLGNSDLVDPSIAHPESRVTYEYRPGYFANLDLFVEHRWSSHFVMREIFGFAKLLNAHPDSVCPEASACRPGQTSNGLAGTPYIGMAFGYFWGGPTSPRTM
jgi:hypothetical protein